MIAVILPPGPSTKMHGLDGEQTLALLPLGDRPILQHIIEGLVSQGITSIEVITGHAPERVEALLGNGDRWGCSFRYHLAAQPERPYRSLKVIAKTKTEPWVLIHAERYPCVTFPASLDGKAAIYHVKPQSGPDAAKGLAAGGYNSMATWGGTAAFPAGDCADTICNMTAEELRAHLQQMECRGECSAIATPEWIDATSPEALLETQSRLLSRRLNGLMINGIERQPGIWVSRNVDVHPSVKLSAPIYIGPNCRINRGVQMGPDVVIGAGCIVDSNTTIEHSLVMAGSYIGDGLELGRTIVNHELLVNVRLDAGVMITEGFLLGGLVQKNRESLIGRAAQSMLACLLVAVFLPITLLSLIYFALVRRLSYTSMQAVRIPVEGSGSGWASYTLPCLGADAWKKHRPAGWSAFVRQFLPGLFAVALGRLNFVGLAPKSIDEAQKLPEEWRSLYRQGRAGLISEASLAVEDEKDETGLYLADAFYSAKRSWSHDAKLALKYLLRLIAPGRAAA